MSNAFFQKLQLVVQRHLYVGLAGASLWCGGCLSCTRVSLVPHPLVYVVDIPPDQRASLVPYLAPNARVPLERCVALCLSARATMKPDSCYFEAHVPEIECGRTERTVPNSGSARVEEPPSSAVCQKSCGPESSSCSLVVPSRITCQYLVVQPMAAGRRPPGLLLNPPAARPSPADWLARSASLESAAVIAFTGLHDELGRIGAPPRLREGCRLAAEEEIRHARLMTELARDAGGLPTAPVVRPGAARSAFQLAVENAVEGCVRETFGALEALWQSYSASDPAVRAVMAQIAEDEARHAQLALALDAWLRTQLSPSQRREVLRAARAAFRSIQRELLAAPSAPALGLLRGTAACELFRSALSSLWPDLLEDGFEAGSVARMPV